MSGIWDPARAELDVEPPRLEPPTVSYVICSTPRSGSSLLARALADTGRGGLPAEYFNPRHRRPLAARWGCGESAEHYVAALVAHRTSRAGVFAVKLHWDQLVALTDELQRLPGFNPRLTPAEVVERLFPGAVLVSVLRLDLDAQAVSLWKAFHTGIWSQRTDQPQPQARSARAPYRRRGIAWCRQAIADGEAGWRRLFLAADHETVEVVYERLVADYAAETHRTLSAILGTANSDELTALETMPAPSSVPLADAHSESLRGRFVREYGRRSGPPPLTARLAAQAVLQRLGRG